MTDVQGLLVGCLAALLAGSCEPPQAECCEIQDTFCGRWQDGQGSPGRCNYVVNDGLVVPMEGYITMYAENGCPYIVEPTDWTGIDRFCPGLPADDTALDTAGDTDAGEAEGDTLEDSNDGIDGIDAADGSGSREPDVVDASDVNDGSGEGSSDAGEDPHD